MAKYSSFVEELLEQTQSIPNIRVRAMFGGHGIYQDKTMFGLVADDELFLKVDDETVEQFEDMASKPFVYDKGDKQVKMSYYSCPDEAFDDEKTMVKWCELALLAAKRATKAKKKK